MKGKVVNCFYDGAGGGLGDFIRGCVYLYGHCKSKGLDFDFDLSKHPINKYISSNCNIEYDVGDIDCLYNKAAEDKKSFLARIKRLTEGVLSYTKDDETKLIYSNFHYYVESGGKMINAMNSMPPLSKGCCNWFKDNINFNPTVNEAVDKSLFKNKLKIGEFNIVHFRIGDQNSFGDKKNSENHFKLCNKHCRRILKNSNLPLVILSDSNELKEYLETMSNRVFVFHLESQHTQSSPAQSGLNLSISEDGLFYAAFDAKLLTLAKKVYSYSVYTHGSGFVFWLCKIFGIDVEMNSLNIPKTKLPVFFHIPKNAGTYINNRCFSFFKQRFGGKDCYHIDVLKDGVITYRLLCRSSKKLCSDYTSINKICYQINFEDLRLDELDLFLLRVADVGFETYKQDIYSLLPENIKPYEFLCLREPYSRTQSLYSYIQSSQSSHEDTNYKLGNLSFVEYLNSPQLEGSWLIRRFLKIPNEIPITEEHFKKTCDLLSEMLIFGMDDIDESLFKVFMECYGMDCGSIIYEVNNNETKDKINTPFNSLDERTKTAFLNQTYWDKKLYEKYIH